MSHRMRPGTWLNVQGVCEADAALWAWWLQARVEMRLRIVDLDALDGADPMCIDAPEWLCPPDTADKAL